MRVRSVGAFVVLTLGLSITACQQSATPSAPPGAASSDGTITPLGLGKQSTTLKAQALPPRSFGVLISTDNNFQGQTFGAIPGIYNFGGALAGTISSFKVGMGYYVRFCTGLNLSGACYTYNPGDYAALPANLNDKFMSVEVLVDRNNKPQAVTVFEAWKYGGNSRSLVPGTYNFPFEGVGGNSISSLKVVAGFQARFCEGSYLEGNCYTYGPGDYDWVGDARNDKFNSVEITPAPPAAVVYEAWQFGGSAQAFGVGVYNLPYGGVDNDTISSLQVAAGYQIKACENLNLGGNCVTYIPGDYGWVGDAVNDKFSSVQITTYASGSGSANRANQGEWSAVVPWPLIPIQAALNPDGQLMTWSSVTDDRTEGWYADVSKQIQTRVDLWNPASNLHRWIDEKLGNDIFCSGFTHAADGSLIVVGGSIREGEGIQASFAYNFVTSAWKKLANLTQKRWYSSATALASGEVLALGTFSDLPEVFNGTGWRQLTNARNGNYNTFFPWTQSAPNGKVFYAGPNSQLSYLDTAGAGNITVTGQRDGIDRYYGSYATYDTGKILTAGGSNLVPGSNQNASTTASVINLNGPVPQVSATESMKNKRTYHTLTILSDGQVLATGGTTSTAAYDANAGVYAAELWNPGSQKWSTLASQKVTRQYHSFALLLPDGRVASGGGGYCCDSKAAPLRANNPINKPNVEFFSPPYLFDAQGNPARRPAINSAPEQISYNQGFNVALGSLGDSAQISKLHLIRLGSVTHGVNMEQRLTPLRFNQSGNTLNATSPLNANITPPGYYMLIAVNDKGVPSVARMIKVGQASWTARSIREKLQSDEASIPHEHDGTDADHDHGAQAQTADHDHADQDHGAGELAVKHTHNE